MKLNQLKKKVKWEIDEECGAYMAEIGKIVLFVTKCSDEPYYYGEIIFSEGDFVRRECLGENIRIAKNTILKMFLEVYNSVENLVKFNKEDPMQRVFYLKWKEEEDEATAELSLPDVKFKCIVWKAHDIYDGKHSSKVIMYVGRRSYSLPIRARGMEEAIFMGYSSKDIAKKSCLKVINRYLSLPKVEVRGE